MRCLLDRLIDDAPELKTEAREDRVLSISQFRASVMRDIAWLFGTTQQEATAHLESNPFIKRSVLNYGLPVLFGYSAAQSELYKLENLLKHVLCDFEPRLIADTITVNAFDDSTGQIQSNLIRFRISGMLLVEPVQVEITLEVEIIPGVGLFRIIY